MTHHTSSRDTGLTYHPSLVDLEAYIQCTLQANEQRDHDTVAAHVHACAECHHMVNRLRELNDRIAGTSTSANTTASADRLQALQARIVASRAQGARVLLPHHTVDADDEPTHEAIAARSPAMPPHGQAQTAAVPSRRWRSALVAAALGGVVLLSLFRPAKTAEAGMIAGSLVLSPAMPKAGEPVTVRYTAGALFGRPAVLRLRARVRTATMDSYAEGIPVVTLATLRKSSNGEYRAQFTLPDSIVFAALAVEDTAATAVDDFGGRTWEVMRATASGTPTFASLDQRAHDLMGRGWEVGLDNARRMVALYPDTVAAWAWLQSFEGWMSLTTDSTNRVHSAQATRLAALYRQRDLISGTNIGRMFWYTRRMDSVQHAPWAERLLRDAPTTEFGVQERLMQVVRKTWQGADTAWALTAIEPVWADAPPVRRAQVASEALDLVPRNDAHAALLTRWLDRLTGDHPSIVQERSAGKVRMTVPSLREAGLAQLTRAAVRSANTTEFTRALDESAEAFSRRVQRSQALSDAALGQALASMGRTGEALRVLRRAADASWDPTVFAALAAASMSAGDTSFAMPHWARVHVDPRTATSRRASLDSLGQRELGAPAWQALLATQRRELSRRVLAEARSRRLDDVSVRDLNGTDRLLSSLSDGKPMVVVIWSPNCGPAVDALPDIQLAGEALTRRGLRVVTIVEQSARDTVLDGAIARARLTLPVYLDPGGKASAAFNNWATPQIYLLDAKGRVQFAPTEDVNLLRLRAEAVLGAQE
jgi:hypothetical protein